MRLLVSGRMVDPEGVETQPQSGERRLTFRKRERAIDRASNRVVNDERLWATPPDDAALGQVARHAVVRELVSGEAGVLSCSMERCNS